MSDEVAPTRTYRIEIIAEDTGEVLQRAEGIPEAKIHALLRALGRAGQIASEAQSAVEGLTMMSKAIRRVLGRK